MADRRPREESALHPPSRLNQLKLECQESSTEGAQKITAVYKALTDLNDYHTQLERDNQYYKDRYKALTDSNEDHTQLERDNQYYKDSLRRTCMNKSAAENIASEFETRPSTLEAKYRDFSRHDRMDAIEIIYKLRKKVDKSKEAEKDDERIACLIFEHAYEEAESLRDNFERFITRILKSAPSVGARYEEKMSSVENQPKPGESYCLMNTLKSEVQQQQDQLGKGIVNSLKFMVKETSHICDVTEIVKRTKVLLRRRRDEKGRFDAYKKDVLPQLEGYIQECCKFAWKLVCQNPPYVLKGQAHFNGLTNTTQSVKRRVLWPGLEEIKTRRVIAKAVLEEPKY